MSGKVEFGVDYLHLMRGLMLVATEDRKLDPISDAAARLYLVHWGLTTEQADDASELFFQRAEEGKLGSTSDVVDRMVEHFDGDRRSQEQLVVEIVSIGFMDFEVSDAEADFVRTFQHEFDFRPSEFKKLLNRGSQLAIGLSYFGSQYAKAMPGPH